MNGLQNNGSFVVILLFRICYFDSTKLLNESKKWFDVTFYFEFVSTELLKKSNNCFPLPVPSKFSISFNDI